MTQEDKPWQIRWDENGWKPKNGLSPYYTPKEYTEEEFNAILREAVQMKNSTSDKFMTQEEKQLLIKDLCARLPYGVMVDYSRDEALKNLKCKYGKLINIQCEDSENVFISVNGVSYLLLENVRPYLRPMSSMMEEEEDELNSARMGNYGEDVDWLNTNHFDYRGLIPMGLALEAPEDMYKTE